MARSINRSHKPRKDNVKQAIKEDKQTWIMEVGMKWRFDTMMVCGIKDGYQPLIAVQGSG